jgi:hypothetical protein
MPRSLVKATGAAQPKIKIMYRRLLTLLLLPALLLTQWVNGSRCMGGCREAGQGSRPHVHLNAELPVTPQMKGCGCQRQREANVTIDSRLSQASVDSDATATTEQAPCRGSHDSILYLSFDSAVVGRASAACSGVDGSDDQVHQPAGLCVRLRWADHLSNHFFSPLVATPLPDAKCPVYLRVCALLI